MCCNVPVEKGVRPAASSCKCYNAVMRMYSAMKDEPTNIILDSAAKVYRFHHPEDSKRDALLTVERWIVAERVH
jgi:hypothetical protein